jgi:hypothetical protein
MRQVLFALVESEPVRSRRIDQLIRQRGQPEVARILDLVQQTSFRRDLLTDEPMLYRDYRRVFARYGGPRRFLDRQEFEALTFEHAMLFGKRQLVALIARQPDKRERELYDLLLKEADLWQDITPPAVPPRPADWSALPSGEYTGPAQALLQWGCDLDDGRIAARAREAARWQPAIPELARMTLDDGLLEGWPGIAASWAPYHALNLLGYLRAHEYARPLLALIDRPNDWLSDQLPQVWARMGLAAEPVMWEYLEDMSHPAQKRGIALAGLEALAKANASQRAGMVAELAERLQNSAASEAQVNGLIVFVLNRMKAVQARDVIAQAFKQGKVDTKVMTPADVEFL